MDGDTFSDITPDTVSIPTSNSNRAPDYDTTLLAFPQKQQSYQPRHTKRKNCIFCVTSFIIGSIGTWASMQLIYDLASAPLRFGRSAGILPANTRRLLGTNRFAPPQVTLLLDPDTTVPTELFPDAKNRTISLAVEAVEYFPNSDKMHLRLEGNNSFVVGKERGEFLDAAGTKVGQILFGAPESHAADSRNLLGKKLSVVDMNKPLMQKVSKKPPPPPPVPPPLVVEGPPIQVPPPIEGVFRAYPSEMYCRYGCGNIQGVTFPYYYRPFFGYGFPILGTESYFPVGYGGNPVTQLGAQGLLGQASMPPPVYPPPI